MEAVRGEHESLRSEKGVEERRVKEMWRAPRGFLMRRSRGSNNFNRSTTTTTTTTTATSTTTIRRSRD
ncbi:hypothetical protein E2C01_055480 [Portunus trituberculatus]|uniref:Uncharacterized protein n=1 Tax=Portunus trituberculatus TaxID=210409 RepID=A0A5B7GWY4_PORTR|nr:hypothetical protein [Portunus trituberculatus]